MNDNTDTILKYMTGPLRGSGRHFTDSACYSPKKVTICSRRTLKRFSFHNIGVPLLNFKDKRFLESTKQFQSQFVLDLSSIVPSNVIKTLYMILQLECPQPCVWNTKLKSSNLSIDQQHSLLLSSLQLIECLMKSKISNNSILDDMVSRLMNIFELWKTHLDYEMSLCSKIAIINMKVFQLYQELDQNTVHFFTEALEYGINPKERSDVNSVRARQAYIQYLAVALQKTIFRHVLLSSLVLNQASSSEFLADDSKTLSDSNRTGGYKMVSIMDSSYCNNKNCSYPSSLQITSPSALQSYRRWSKRISHHSRIYLGFILMLRLSQRLGFSHVLSQPSRLSSALRKNYNSLKERLIKRSRKTISERLIQASLDTAIWDDLSPTENFLDTLDTDVKLFKLGESQSVSDQQTIESKVSTANAILSTTLSSGDYHSKCKESRESLVDISRMPEKSFHKDDRFDRGVLWRCDLDFKVTYKGLEVATLLIDIRHKRYRMVRGDIQLRNMTLYQPWHLAGHQFEFLICKNRKPQRHEALLIHKIKHFFKQCSRYSIKGSSHENPPDYLIERLTIHRQNDTSLSVIAVFLLVIALNETYVLCLFISDQSKGFTFTFPSDTPESCNDFFIWLAKHFVQGGHPYERLFAEPFL